jgi:polyhydroxyalkanoate synthase subunit PhaC
MQPETRAKPPEQRRGAPVDLLAEQQKMLRRFFHLPRLFEMAQGIQVGTTPRDLVLERHGFKLYRYRRETPARYAQPVLFCYALVNRSYILDLLPDKSVVGRYLQEGFEVYLIDWRTPTDQDRGLTIEDYVCRFLSEAVTFIQYQHGRQDLHLLGYCMGGTLSTLYTAINPAAVRTLTLLAVPIDFSGREALLHLWTDPATFDVDHFIDVHGNCPAWFLQTCFLFMKPVQNFLEKNFAFFDQLDEPTAISNYFAMERWINDNVPVAGATFREFVKKFYQGNQLVKGEYHLGNHRIDLGRITTPLLLLTATNDHLVAPASTEGIRPHVRSEDIRSMTIAAGHVGLVVGGKAQRTLWPEATRWLAERSTAADAADAPATAKASSSQTPSSG